MNQVILIATDHVEQGRATSAALHALLVQLRPGVIFLEVPSANFASYYETRERWNLESIAVGRYLEHHRAVLVPVDAPTPPAAFFDRAEAMHRRIWKASPAYRAMNDLHRRRVAEYGFAYFNSEQNDRHWVAAYEEMERMLGVLAEPGLKATFESWIAVKADREDTMIEGIDRYCGAVAFGMGAFLVGAAHRKALLEKYGAVKASRSAAVKWELTALPVRG